jgi:DNA-binding transcriptional ArsR family regulator
LELWLTAQGHNHIFHSSRNIEGAAMETRQVVGRLSALAQETRLELFRLLVQQGANGLPAGVIAERLGVPASSLSFHLQQLVHAGLITQRRVSRQIFYAADYGVMNALMAYLTENCCGGSGTAAAAACVPGVCNPADAFAATHGEPDEAPARARQRR